MKTIALGTDAGLYRMVPGVVIRVESEEELKVVMAACHDLDLPFTFRGSGTSVSGQAISESVLIMLSEAWKEVRVYDGDNRVTARCASTGGEINACLAPFQRKLGPDPASLQSATIGGMVANNSSGMGCGVAKNSQKTLASMRLILADGAVLDTGDIQSREAFRASHSHILDGLETLARQIRNTPEVLSRIQKNTPSKTPPAFPSTPLWIMKIPLRCWPISWWARKGVWGLSQASPFTPY